MDCLGQMWNIVPCLWDCSNKHAAYISGLEGNLISLRDAMDELNNLSRDVKNRVQDAQQQQRRPRNQVTGWLRSVETLERKVNPILQKGTREVENKCVGSCCPKNCWSSYGIGKKVLEMLPKVEGLIEKGCFDDVADDNSVAALVDELPMEGIVVGFESKLEEVWQSVQDKDSTIIGILGIGGVGKTTLLKQLNNEFLKSGHGFDLVIWIVVSKSANVSKIQETIRNKLNIRNDFDWRHGSEDERAIQIFNNLKNKKFVVLLDDLWEKLELSKVGIPQPCSKNMSKVVFTTRSQRVCQCMNAPKFIKVECLPQDQALNLFRSNVGEDMLKSHQKLHELVKDVADECQGLPLALITIGQSMKGKTDVRQWKDAKRALEKYPSTFPGMKDGVFSKLVFSYDSLPTLTLQQCFQYCSIFPEDHNIEEEEIIKLWLTERLIDEYDSVYDALVQGRQIIESLMQACLLEVGEEEGTIKMHDVIRDMALWLACERGEKNNKFWVDVLSGDDVLSVDKWRYAEKVSLWESGHDPFVSSRHKLSMPFCSNLVTLIIRNTNLQELECEFFQSMTCLKVLDLTDNRSLLVLPTGIGSLINLEYLNIVGTRVRRLPLEVGQLKKLRFLLLSYITIPGTVVSSLSLLQTFTREQNIEWGWDIDNEAEERKTEREMLEQLERLKHIMDLGLVIRSTPSMLRLFNSSKLGRCTRQLSLVRCTSLPEDVLDLSTRSLMEHLERLEIAYCTDMLVIKLGSCANISASSKSSYAYTPLTNLRHVSIKCCNKIRNVNSLIYISNLCTLYVRYCHLMEELIGEDAQQEQTEIHRVRKQRGQNDDTSILLFSSLKSLTLWNLPKLRSICPQFALPFPSLKEMEVIECKSLKKLPFDSNTANTTPPEFKVRGQSRWWDELQWDSQATMEAFTPKFHGFDPNLT